MAKLLGGATQTGLRAFTRAVSPVLWRGEDEAPPRWGNAPVVVANEVPPMFPRVSLFIGLLAAVLLSQLPEFAQQYSQRLGGAISELRRIVDQFQLDAATAKVTPDAAINRLHTNADDLARKYGMHMREATVRLQRLQEQEALFNQAGAVRVLVLMRDFDPTIAREALQIYRPAVPTTAEGLITTIVGFFLGGGLTRLLAAPFRRRSPPPPTYAMAGADRDDLSRAEAIRLRARINKARLPRPGAVRDSRDA